MKTILAATIALAGTALAQDYSCQRQPAYVGFADLSKPLERQAELNRLNAQLRNIQIDQARSETERHFQAERAFTFRLIAE